MGKSDTTLFQSSQKGLMTCSSEGFHPGGHGNKFPRNLKHRLMRGARQTQVGSSRCHRLRTNESIYGDTNSNWGDFGARLQSEQNSWGSALYSFTETPGSHGLIGDEASDRPGRNGVGSGLKVDSTGEARPECFSITIPEPRNVKL